MWEGCGSPTYQKKMGWVVSNWHLKLARRQPHCSSCRMLVQNAEVHLSEVGQTKTYEPLSSKKCQVTHEAGEKKPTSQPQQTDRSEPFAPPRRPAACICGRKTGPSWKLTPPAKENLRADSRNPQASHLAGAYLKLSMGVSVNESIGTAFVCISCS